MKSILSIICLLPFSLFAAPAIAPDTVIIRIGGEKEIKIIANEEDELESLSQYDLNAIIRDIRQQADQDGQNVYIRIEDNTGQKYIYKQSRTDDSVTLEFKLKVLSKKMENLGDSLDRVLNREEKRKRKNRGTTSTVSFDLGFNNYLSDGKFPDESNAPYAVNPFYSWYIAVGGLNKTHVAGPLYINWGANVSWYNFKFENTRTRITKTDEQVSFAIDSTVENPIKSKLVVPYLNGSLVPLLKFNRRRNKYDDDKGFRIGVGAYAGYRLGSKSKYVTIEDGDRERAKERTNYYVNNWRYGARLQLGLGGIDVFANYDLNELFNEGKGPQLNAFSFGIMF